MLLQLVFQASLFPCAIFRPACLLSSPLLISTTMYLPKYSLWLLSFGASPASAAIGLNQFYFPGNVNNASAMKCGNLAFQCRPPSMCGWDNLMQRWYCCSPGVHAVCSTSAQTCNGRDNKTPAANQQLCGAGINSYCCDSTRYA